MLLSSNIVCFQIIQADTYCNFIAFSDGICIPTLLWLLAYWHLICIDANQFYIYDTASCEVQLSIAVHGDYSSLHYLNLMNISWKSSACDYIAAAAWR